MSGSMNVEMVLRLVDQATAPLRGVTSEFEKLEKAAKDLGRGAGAKMGAHEYFEGLKRAGDEAEHTRRRVDELRDSLSRIGTTSLAFQDMASVGAGLAKPMDTAIDKAREFQKQIRSITVAGDILGQDEAIGRGIMVASRASGLKWEEIARGERQLVELGGGEYVAKIAHVREQLAKLGKAAEADPAELYNMMYHYMELNHLTEQQAYEALAITYAQGKKGAYELKEHGGGPSEIGRARHGLLWQERRLAGRRRHSGDVANAAQGHGQSGRSRHAPSPPADEINGPQRSQMRQQLPEFLVSSSLMGKLASGLGKGLILSAVEMAGSWAINKAFDVTPEREAKARENIHAGADEFYKDMHLPRPQWPSLVSEAHGEPTRPLEVAKDKADAAGAALKAGLDVTLTPTIDLSCFDALDARLAKATRGFKEFAAAAKSAAGAAAHSIRHGYQPGSHALHDGSELY